MAVSRLRLHAVFCKNPDGFPFLRERTDFGAVRNANIIQMGSQCAMSQLMEVGWQNSGKNTLKNFAN